LGSRSKGEKNYLKKKGEKVQKRSHSPLESALDERGRAREKFPHKHFEKSRAKKKRKREKTKKNQRKSTTN
jgi:hypothetical protein